MKNLENQLPGVENKIRPEDLGDLGTEGSKIEQVVEQPELSPEEQPEDLNGQITAQEQEIAKLTESIEGTKSKLSAVREGLGLPPTEEDPSSITSEKDTLEKLQREQEELEKQKEEIISEQENKGQKPETKEGGESLKENELVTSDIDIKAVENVLKKNEVYFKSREYSKRQILDSETGTAVPGEFVITIFNSKELDKPASFDFTKKVFEFIKNSELVIRYGKNPERG